MVQAKKSKKAKRVIPGFGLSLGVTIAASFLILFLVNMVQHRNAKILKGGR